MILLSTSQSAVQTTTAVNLSADQNHSQRASNSHKTVGGLVLPLLRLLWLMHKTSTTATRETILIKLMEQIYEIVRLYYLDNIDTSISKIVQAP